MKEIIYSVWRNYQIGLGLRRILVENPTDYIIADCDIVGQLESCPDFISESSLHNFDKTKSIGTMFGVPVFIGALTDSKANLGLVNKDREMVLVSAICKD